MIGHEITAGERTVYVREDGAAEGVPVVVHHGTPSCGIHPAWVADDARRQGVRLLGIDRPGYGGSTRARGRTVADVAADVAMVADALGLERFGVFGISGGGPHVLATAALLGDRVSAAVCMAGVAPFDAVGLNYFAGMGAENWVETGAALQGEAVLTAALEPMGAAMASANPDDILASLGSLVGPRDRAVLDAPMLEFLADGSRLGLEPGVAGWVDDDLAFVAPWGFDPAAITVPVLIVHGRDDRFVPVAHGEWLAATIPGADVRISNRDGHLSPLRDIPAVHAWLLDHSA